MKKSLIIPFLMLVLSVFSNAGAQTFENFTTANSGLPDDFVCGGVAIDTSGNKWFATASGVAVFDNTNWTVYDTSDGLIDMYANAIAVDKNNNVWVGTASGVSRFDGSSWTSFTTADGLIDNNITAIAGDIDGSVWFATLYGASKLSGSVWTDFTTSDGLPSNEILCLTIDSLGNKWFGTMMFGLAKYDNSSVTVINAADKLIDTNVFAVAVDDELNTWAGTWYGASLFDYSNNWMADYDTAQGLFNNYIRDIDIDSKGNVWFALFADYNQEGGISKFDGSSWQSFTMTDGLVDKQVIRMALDSYDNLWIATGMGVSKLSAASGIGSYSRNNGPGVYPSPADDYVVISGNPDDETEIMVFSVSGQKLFSCISDHDVRLNTAGFTNGLYYVRAGTRHSAFVVSH